jgi:hypothetical protein
MSPAAPSTTITPTLRRRRGLTEQAAVAAVDQACRRLRLPTVRAVLDEALTVAGKEQLSYQGFLAEPQQPFPRKPTRPVSASRPHHSGSATTGRSSTGRLWTFRKAQRWHSRATCWSQHLSVSPLRQRTLCCCW